MKSRQLVRLAAGAACPLSGTAHAQTAPTTVTLYGLVDTGIEYLGHAGPGGSGGVARLSPGNVRGSRWGPRGKEDLGGGLNAVFVLESWVNSDTGSSGRGGRLLGRQIQYAPRPSCRSIRSAITAMACCHRMRSSPIGPITRSSTTGNFGNLTITGLFSAGYDANIANGAEVPGAPRIGQELSAGTSYTIGKLGMVLAYDQRRGAAAATQANIERRYATGLLWSSGPFTAVVGYRFLQGTIAAPSLRPPPVLAGRLLQYYPGLGVPDRRLSLRSPPDDGMSYAISTLYNLSKGQTCISMLPV